MRKHILRFLTTFAEKFILISTSLNRIWCLYHVFDFHKIYADKNLSYEISSIQTNKETPTISDERTNFLVRVLLENNYKRMVEIGAYDLRRPFHYKRTFPDLEVFALDIIPGFQTGITDGIHTARFDLAWFSQNAEPNTIITSAGTLTCLNQMN